MKNFTTPIWQNLSLLVLRITLGVIFIPHGWSKWERGLTSSAQWLDQKAYPLPQLMAVLLIAFEALGPLFIIPGLFTRLIALGWMIMMTLAILTVHLPEGLKGMEFPLVLWAGSFLLVLQGGGQWSLDRLLAPLLQDKLGLRRWWNR